MAGVRAVVLGLGTFGGGLGAACWLARHGAEVVVTDRAGPERFGGAVDRLAELGVRTAFGGHEGVDFAGADLLVVNPAVPLSAGPVVKAERAGVEVTSEIALLMERWPGPLLGITGSNGKSTTASLAHALLRGAGVPVSLGGNLGGSLLDELDDAETGRVAVLELSSFMLELLARRGVGPDVAVILNITPNHLDRHEGFDAYVRAKAGILSQARTAVLFADDEAVRTAALGFEGRVLRFGSRGDLVVTPEGELQDRHGLPVLTAGQVPLRGRAGALDLAAALLAAGAVSGDAEAVRGAAPAALETWHPLPHRMEEVVVPSGLRWVDDSVSTTPESTAASLEALGCPCLLIAGGRDKGLDPAALLDSAVRWARVVLTVGEQGGALAAALTARGVTAEAVGSVPVAVQRAANLARRGETVLLSPGYSSHDQFYDYSHRGRRYVAEVLRTQARPTRALSEDGAEC